MNGITTGPRRPQRSQPISAANRIVSIIPYPTPRQSLRAQQHIIRDGIGILAVQPGRLGDYAMRDIREAVFHRIKNHRHIGSVGLFHHSRASCKKPPLFSAGRKISIWLRHQTRRNACFLLF